MVLVSVVGCHWSAVSHAAAPLAVVFVAGGTSMFTYDQLP